MFSCPASQANPVCVTQLSPRSVDRWESDLNTGVYGDVSGGMQKYKKCRYEILKKAVCPAAG